MKRSPVVMHPFFFAIYAVLGVYAENIGNIAIKHLTRPLLIVLSITILFFLNAI